MARAKKEVVKEEFDVEKLKKELSDYVDKEVKKSINDRIDTANKRVIKEKNKKILARDILIIILIGIISFLVYILYNENYFDRFFVESNNQVNNEQIEKKVENKESTLDELKEKYGYLLDNISINEESNYIKDYYEGNLTDPLKKYLTLNTMDFNDITVEDDVNIIDEELFKKEYSKIFNDKYKNSSFDYNGISIKYLNKLNSYITSNILEKKDSNIKREIVDIKINNNEIEITTVEGLVKEGMLYNIITNDELGEYQDNNDLLTYKEDLNKVIYVFKGNKLLELKNA